MTLTEFCRVLNQKLQQSTEAERVPLAALALQQAFKVAADEVAFLVYDDAQQSLSFCWPKRLARAGSIPLKTRDSLAAVTARERRPQLNNRFTSTQHASIFELVKLHDSARDTDDRPGTIQKVMSAPLLSGDTLVGVVQVSRKGADTDQAGPDFTQPELEALACVADVITAARAL